MKACISATPRPSTIAVPTTSGLLSIPQFQSRVPPSVLSQPNPVNPARTERPATVGPIRNSIQGGQSSSSDLDDRTKINMERFWRLRQQPQSSSARIRNLADRARLLG